MEWYNHVCVLVYACECICGFLCVHMDHVCVLVYACECICGFLCVHMEWCVCIWVVCVHTYGVVCMHMDCVCAYGVVCMHMGVVREYEWCVCIRGLCVCIWSDVCVCIIWLVKSFLMFLWRCSFLSGHWLILCAAVVGTAEPVPSYQAGWHHCFGSISVAMYVVVVARGRWGLMIPSSTHQPLRRRVPYLPVGVLPAPSQAFGLIDRPVCCGGCSF